MHCRRRDKLAGQGKEVFLCSAGKPDAIIRKAECVLLCQLRRSCQLCIIANTDAAQSLDGSLDSEKFEKWVLDEIGGNPDNINPEKEEHDDL